MTFFFFEGSWFFDCWHRESQTRVWSMSVSWVITSIYSHLFPKPDYAVDQGKE